mgnify:CR=1 FL=1
MPENRNYLQVTYKTGDKNLPEYQQDFLLKETHLITKVLREQSIDGKCTVELKTVTEKEYKILFG